MLLSLDVSTTTVGVCILDDVGEIVLLDHIDLSKHKVDVYKKAVIVKTYLEKLAKEYEYTIDKIVIEEFLLRFRPGKSSAHTLTTLARFNGIISFICSQVFLVTPSHTIFTHARKVVGIHIDKKLKKTIGLKTIIIDFAKSALGDKLKIDYTKTGKYKPYMADRADAWVLARATYLDNL